MPIVRHRHSYTRVYGRGLKDDIFRFLHKGAKFIQGKNFRKLVNAGIDTVKTKILPQAANLAKDALKDILPEAIQSPANMLVDSIANNLATNKSIKLKKNLQKKLTEPLNVFDRNAKEGSGFAVAIPGNPLYQAGDALGLGQKMGSGVKRSRKMNKLVNARSKGIVDSLVKGRGLSIL